jgi:transcriptional regulator with XRE-family HTH domain
MTVENERVPIIDSPEYWVSRRVRELRETRGWSQTELAERLKPYGFDMHQTTVAKLERGGRPIRVNEAAALADVFQVGLGELLANGERPVGVLDEAGRRLREVRRLRVEYEQAQRFSRDLEREFTVMRDKHVHAVKECHRLGKEVAEAEEALRQVTSGAKSATWVESDG